MPDEFTINQPVEREAYRKIKNKIEKVRDLYEGLNQNLPCRQRVEYFKSRLKDYEQDLQMHRDPAWMIYCRVCVAVLALIATGIVPGLVGLALHYGITGRSSFFQSRGADYVQDVTRGCRLSTQGY